MFVTTCFSVTLTQNYCHCRSLLGRHLNVHQMNVTVAPFPQLTPSAVAASAAIAAAITELRARMLARALGSLLFRASMRPPPCDVTSAPTNQLALPSSASEFQRLVFLALAIGLGTVTLRSNVAIAPT